MNINEVRKMKVGQINEAEEPSKSKSKTEKEYKILDTPVNYSLGDWKNDDKTKEAKYLLVSDHKVVAIADTYVGMLTANSYLKEKFDIVIFFSNNKGKTTLRGHWRKEFG
jgi:hypothetical protein